MISAAEGLLHRWGKWGRDNPGLLFSSTNILKRVQDEGAGASQPAGKREIPMSDDIAVVEQCVLMMDDDIKAPIILKFVSRMPPGQLSKACHLHSREINKLIGYGVYFLAGYIAK